MSLSYATKSLKSPVYTGDAVLEKPIPLKISTKSKSRFGTSSKSLKWSRAKRARIDKESFRCGSSGDGIFKDNFPDTVKCCRGDDCFGSLCNHFPNVCVMCSKGRAYQIEYCFRCIIEEGMEMSYELCDVDRNYKNFRQSYEYGYEDGIKDINKDIISQHLDSSKCIYDGVKDFYKKGYIAGVNEYKISQLLAD